MSNLTFLSKLLERMVCRQLTDLLDANNTISSIQNAYRRFQYTESAQLKVYSYILMAMDRGHLTLLGLLDLSDAFDTEDHSILLKRLEMFSVSWIHF